MPDPTTAHTAPPRRRFAPLHAAVAVIVLVIAGWGLAGGSGLRELTVIAWSLVGLGVLAGLALVISGMGAVRRRR
ncbi:hypothetical protein GCM10027169_04830 [Gordonia jinhuaensis]|uniref:Uncharacterized protein n=1 Tax=Gordonia jinhuaensis TaxID=1517702 RepID=A0A916WMV1_9ACTN|nr:hypothetical protein [Gordonia jinhuaensis]GGB17342.1 hypothetical protein GCM10011489_01790 [Gordonia jinhuaensis]